MLVRVSTVVLLYGVALEIIIVVVVRAPCVIRLASVGIVLASRIVIRVVIVTVVILVIIAVIITAPVVVIIVVRP